MEENSSLNINNKEPKKNKYLLFLIPLFFILGFVLFFLNKKTIEEKPSETPLSEDIIELSPTTTPEKKSTGLGYPVIRVAKHNYSSWKEYKSTKGNLAIYYPSYWNTSETTVFSWDPEDVKDRRGGLGLLHSKWDMDLIYSNGVMPEYIQDIFDIHTDEQNYHLFEVTESIDGWPIYIATVEAGIVDPENLLGGHDYLVAIIVTPNGWLSWHGFAGIDDSDSNEILKQILESIHFSK